MSEPDSPRPILDANEYMADCFRLARKIWDDGYRFDFLVALWRGGTPPGIAIQEYFRYRGHDPYHTAIRTQSMEGIREGDGYDIKGLEHVIDVVCAEDRMLIVDDLLDTGRTIYEVTEYLRRRARRNTPEIRVATVYFRPERRRFLVGPDYYLKSTEASPVFPHRLTEMDLEQLQSHDAELAEALRERMPVTEPGGSG